MKRITQLLSVLAFLFFANIASAQIHVGGGIAIGSDNLGIGLDLRGGYEITDMITGVVSLNLYSGDDFGNTKLSYTGINFDGHYNFEMSDGLVLYPLAGINILAVKVKSDFGDSSASDVGLNLGGGAAYDFSDQLFGFGELKLIAGNGSGLVIVAGVGYRI